MKRRDNISGKFKPPENETVKKDLKTVLNRHPFIDKTNMLHVPSNLNKNVSKVVQKRKETRSKENLNDVKKTQVKSKTILRKLDDNKLQRELRININNILPSYNVPDCTKVMEVNNTGVTKKDKNVLFHGVYNALVDSHVRSTKGMKTRDRNTTETEPDKLQSIGDAVGAKEDYKLHHDPKFNSRCVVRLAKFDNKLGVKSSNDVRSTVQEVQTSTKVVYKKSSSTSASENNDTQGETSHANPQIVESKMINEVDKSKTVPIINRSTSYETSRKYLRKQVKKDYAETTLDNSQEVTLPSSVSTKKVPIYKSQRSGDEKTRKRTDVYEFDEVDSDKENGHKNKRDINKSEKFDKTMYKILQKIESEEAKLQAKNKRKVIKKTGNSRKRKEPLQGTEKRVMKKIPVETKPEDKNHKGSIVKSGANVRNVADTPGPENKNSRGSIVKCSTNVQNLTIAPGHENKPENKNSVGSVVKCSENVQNVVDMPEYEILVPEITSTDVPEDDFSDDNEEFFGFGEVQHSTPVKINPNINIISNIALKDVTSSNLFDNLRPNANSTMLNSDKRSPWRFHENVKRNPHFITVKRSALPCIKQDMVLDYAKLEKSEHFSNSKKKSEIRVETPRKTLVQKSIKDFLSVSSDNVLGLFEDPEQVISLNMPSKIYEGKRRRKRQLSVDVDEEENHPKKKNMMTKKEEDEFEKWAAMFNSECEEIEKYNLEIE